MNVGAQNQKHEQHKKWKRTDDPGSLLVVTFIRVYCTLEKLFLYTCGTATLYNLVRIENTVHPGTFLPSITPSEGANLISPASEATDD